MDRREESRQAQACPSKRGEERRSSGRRKGGYTCRACARWIRNQNIIKVNDVIDLMGDFFIRLDSRAKKAIQRCWRCFPRQWRQVFVGKANTKRPWIIELRFIAQSFRWWPLGAFCRRCSAPSASIRGKQMYRVDRWWRRVRTSSWTVWKAFILQEARRTDQGKSAFLWRIPSHF